MALFWHRRDLRVSDNVGLDAARGAGPVVPVFVIDRDVLDHASPPRVAFMCDALNSLRASYREQGGDLLIAHGDPRDVIPDLAREHGVDRVVWNRDYSGLARERDAAVRQALDDAGIDREAHHDAIHHKPGSITTNKGDIYSVYTYFWKKWRDRPKAEPLDLLEREDLADLGGGNPVPTPADLGFAEPEAEVPAASTEAARERLHSFCAGPIYEYAEQRDYPTADCTSRLSAHLKWGTIGPREVYAATDRAMADANGESARDSVEEFQSQLAWREFYTHVLWGRPDVVTSNYKDYENEIAWRADPEALQAWKDGETGYPIVDAGMRQLRAEAYMHNRLRMIVASFLTKDLMIDWRAGYDWFRRKLVDHETGNDNGGWQWAASTGTDAQPYFRIFNPMTQGERYDPDAEYIAEYVPELRDVPADAVHSWHELDPGTRKMHAPDYPDPIVDHSERREEAIAMFEAARGE
ncbi:MAG: deoxyribodipyrimidine photo-lyase [Halobacteriales archaeon]